MAGPGGNRAILAIWSVIRTAAYPEGACDDDGRRAFEEEAQEANARIVRWLPGVAGPMNALAVVVFLRRLGVDAAAGWVSWLVGLNAVVALLAIPALIVAWRGRPAAVWRGLGDLGGAIALLGAAARSANAQRAHPNINLYLGAMFVIACFVRM